MVLINHEIHENLQSKNENIFTITSVVASCKLLFIMNFERSVFNHKFIAPMTKFTLEK